MKIDKITPQIAALYLGHMCDFLWINNDFPDEKWGGERICASAIERLEEGYLVITPHLRRLETITDNECAEIGDLEFSIEIDDIIKNMTIGHPPTWLYLLSKGFDLFGLIDAGLAKEITTQTNEL